MTDEDDKIVNIVNLEEYRQYNELPTIIVRKSELPRMVREAMEALFLSPVPVFVRAGSLVFPVEKDLQAANGRVVKTARLQNIVADLLVRWLAEVANFEQWDRRSKSMVPIAAPRQVAATLLVSSDIWEFPHVIGVTVGALLQADGTLLTTAGYNPPTQLIVVPDPLLQLPPLRDEPTKGDAYDALQLLLDLLSGFEFKTEIDRAVGLSLALTAVARPIMMVAPLHLVRATTPGVGKSHLVDTAATIATGRHCPVITPGHSPEETEKRLGALLREGVPLISLDNCSRDLDGDLLCQLVERPLVRTRVLGVSEAPEFECRATVAATGNNIGPRGDLVRRTLVCDLITDQEHPEHRHFTFDPVKTVLTHRGAYLAACCTLIRAYIVAGCPEVGAAPFGSYDQWTRMVRAPLMWVGEADPVRSSERAYFEDPNSMVIRELFSHWQRYIGLAESTALQVRDLAVEMNYDNKPERPEFRDLLIRKAGDRGDRTGVSTYKLGRWLRQITGRVVDGLRLQAVENASGGHGPKFCLQRLDETAEAAPQSTLL
jgi:putative DNA primase/helicase